MPTRRIVFIAFEHVQTLDVTGPWEVFSQANRGSAEDHYEIELGAPGGAELLTSSGLRIMPDGPLEASGGQIDTLIVPGGRGARRATGDERVIGWLRDAAQRSRRVVSVCTGAFLLAEAGLLEGRWATTHWAACAALARSYPAIDVDPDPIYVRDGNVYTSAGVTAGIDLTLALVEEDLGPRVALQVARQLVLFVQRPGGQAQFSAVLAGQAASRPGIRELQEWIADHLEQDLTVPALAERAFMSPRNFARVFTAEVGVTPAAYVESVRLERARILLESSVLSLEEVAAKCGFGTIETMRRTFSRRVHISPGDYRERFQNVIPINRMAAS